MKHITLSRIDKKLILLFVLLIVIALFWIVSEHKKTSKVLIITGRVELDEILIRTEVPGKVIKLYVREGQKVLKEQPLAQIDISSLKIESKMIEKEIEAKKELIKAREAELRYLKVKVDSIINEAKAALKQAQAKLTQAKVEYQRRRDQYLRFKRLYQKGVLPQDRYEEIQRNYLYSKQQVKVAQLQISVAKTKLITAKALPYKIQMLEKQIKATHKELQALKAKLDRLKLDIQKATIKTPSNGIVYKKLIEEGEIIPLMGPLYVILKPSTVHVKTFIPETWLAKVRIGQPVKVITDAYPKQPFKGVICYISNRAEFTPKEIDTSEERVKQVFETKICFNREIPQLKKGMPVEIVLKESE